MLETYPAKGGCGFLIYSAAITCYSILTLVDDNMHMSEFLLWSRKDILLDYSGFLLSSLHIASTPLYPSRFSLLAACMTRSAIATSPWSPLSSYGAYRSPLATIQRPDAVVAAYQSALWSVKSELLCVFLKCVARNWQTTSSTTSLKHLTYIFRHVSL